MSPKKEDVFVTEGDIFADIGLENSEELLARSDLMSEVSQMIQKSKLSQKEIAKKLGIAQMKVALLLEGKLSAFTIDALLHYLRLLGCNIEIGLRSKRKISKTLSRGKLRVYRNTPRKIRRTKRVGKY